MVLQVMMADIKRVETGAIVVGFHEDVRPLKGGAGELDWILCGALSRLLIEHKVSGVAGEIALMTTAGKLPVAKLFMVGMGRYDASGPEHLEKAARSAAAALVRAGIGQAAMDLFPLGGEEADAALDAVRRGLTEGAAGRDLQVTLLAKDSESYRVLSRIARP